MPDNPLSTLQSLDPDCINHLHAFQEFVYKDGALPKKMKLLIAVAFDASHGAIGGVKSLAAQALEAGATKEEILEALRVAYLFGGLGSLYIASQGLKDMI